MPRISGDDPSIGLAREGFDDVDLLVACDLQGRCARPRAAASRQGVASKWYVASTARSDEIRMSAFVTYAALCA
jgi:hypothetical protein